MSKQSTLTAPTDVLDYISRGAATPRKPLWPAMSWRVHLLYILVAGAALLAAYSNSFGPGDGRRSEVNWTLDNKYIIQLDPRTKAESWEDSRPGKAGVKDIWIRDYWWPKGISGLYRPIVSFTYWINWHLMSGDENQISPTLDENTREQMTDAITHHRLVIFHVVNYFSHWLVVVLVYFVALMLTQRFWTAAAIGLLFGLHPIAVESVTNIIGRADIFASITVFGGLLLYVRSTRSNGFRKVPWLVALAVLTLFGVFSKESAVAVAGAIALYDFVFRWEWDEIREMLIVLIPLGAGAFVAEKMFGTKVAGAFAGSAAAYLLISTLVQNPKRLWREPWRTLWIYMATFAVPLLAMAVVRAMVFGAATPPETPFLDNPIRGVNWYAGRITALQVMVRLWGLLVWPYHLCCDYSFNQVPTFGQWSTPLNDAMGVLASLLVLAVFLAGLYLRKIHKTASFFILFFFVAFLPTSNLIVTIGSIMAERFLYLPMVGFVGCLVLGIEWIIQRIRNENAPTSNPLDWQVGRRIATALFVVIGVLYGVRTFIRNKDWRSDLTLWQSGIEISPASFRSYQSYAFALFEEFNLPLEKRQPETHDVKIEDCIRVVEQGRPIVDLLPDRMNSSRLYLHQGMYWALKSDVLLRRQREPLTPELRAEITDCLRRAASALNRGVAIDRAFNLLNRQKEFERGKTEDEISDTGLPQIYDYLGTVFSQLGLLDRAMECFTYFRHLDPLNPEGYNKIANVYSVANRHEQASIAIIQSLWLDPSQTSLWKPLADEIAPLNPEKLPAVIIDPTTKSPRLDRSRAIVETTLCSAYQGLTRIFLESKIFMMADRVYANAVRDAAFPKSLFDDIYKEYHRAPPVIPPRPPAK